MSEPKPEGAAKQKRELSKDAEYVLDLLVSAGHLSRETAFHARDITLAFTPEELEAYVPDSEAVKA